MTNTVINISKLPEPDVIEEISYDSILTELTEYLKGEQPMFLDSDGKAVRKRAEFYREENGDRYLRVPVLEDEGLEYIELESDPAMRQLQIVAYREMLLRQRVNEASLAVMLAYAKGADLDHIGVFYNVQRLVLQAPSEAEPDLPLILESDEDFRVRIQVSLEQFATAGTEGAYVFNALSAHADIKDATASAPEFRIVEPDPSLPDGTLPDDAVIFRPVSDAGLTDPKPGDVRITVLSKDGNGTASPEVIQAVELAVNDESKRPITDRVRVYPANIIGYTVNADIYTYAGPDSDLVISSARNACRAYADENHRLGRDITLSGIYAALHVPGVQKVELTNITEDIVCEKTDAAYCTAINLTYQGIGE